MRLQKFAVLAPFVLWCSPFLGCGADDPAGSDRQVGALQAVGGSGGSGGAQGVGGTGGTSSTDTSNASSSSSSSSSSSAGSTGSSMGECQIMSSNTECAECLADKCCFVINECMDEAYLSCVTCLDSFLSHDGDTFCEEGVGKNHWIVECVAFNCETECAEG